MMKPGPRLCAGRGLIQVVPIRLRSRPHLQLQLAQQRVNGTRRERAGDGLAGGQQASGAVVFLGCISPLGVVGKAVAVGS